MISVAVAVVVLLLALLLFLWRVQERVAFQPQGPPYPVVEHIRRVEYQAEDGQRLFAYVVGEDREARGVLLVFHGNADLAAWQIPWAEKVARQTGWTVFLAEYRGYGGLSGRPTYRGLQADARAAHRFISDSLEADRDRLAIFGHSLGTAVAVELAHESNIRALLLQSPFTSTQDMARRMLTPAVAVLWRFLSRIPYDTRARVAQLQCPVWVVHGADDTIIPVGYGRAVFAAAAQKGELLIIEHAGHNDLSDTRDPRYWEWMERALR